MLASSGTETAIESDTKKPSKKSKASKRSSGKKPTAAELKATALAEAKAQAQAQAQATAALAAEKQKNQKTKKSDAAPSGSGALAMVSPSFAAQPGRHLGRAEDRETLSFFDGVANFVFNYAERYHGHQR